MLELLVTLAVDVVTAALSGQARSTIVDYVHIPDERKSSQNWQHYTKITTCCLDCSRPCAPGELRGVADTVDGEDDHAWGEGAAGDTSGDDCSPGDTGAEAAEVPSLSSSRHLILHRL